MTHDPSDAQLPLQSRAVCYTCDKPRRLCICAAVPRVPNRTQVVLLQHPRERRHPVGSARLARLGLERIHFEVCWDLTASAEAQALAAEGRCGILFPSDQAQPLTGPVPDLDHLFVVDGTWTQAKGLVKANPWMQRVPHYAITPDGIDRYRIRREPKAEYTSTIEAIVTALTILEPNTRALDALLEAFNTFIARQVNNITEERAGSRRRRRPHVQHGPIPREFAAARDNLVVVYPEFTYKRVHGVALVRSLIYWTAYHLGTGAVFDAVVKPTHLVPSATHLQHIGLQADALDGGCDMATLRQRWREFCPPGTHVAGWNQASLDLLRQELDRTCPAWLLKGLYCNLQRGQSGHLEDVVAKHSLVAEPLTAVQGRATQRLSNAVAIARMLLF